MTESLDYLVVDADDDVELRQYPPYIVAEVDVQADRLKAAANAGFSPLAEYIFGNNIHKDTIAMTAPVTARASGQQIAMTAPVTSASAADGTYTVRFSMPSSWTLETLPKPNNPGVRLVPIDAELVLAIGYRGRDSEKRMTAGAQQLVDYAAKRQFEPEGEPYWAGYSAPTVPVPLRKWEMLLAVRRDRPPSSLP